MPKTVKVVSRPVPPDNAGGVRVWTPTLRMLKQIKEETGFSNTRSVTALVEWACQCPPELRDIMLGRVSRGLLPGAIEIAKRYLDSLAREPSEHLPTQHQLLPKPVHGLANDPNFGRKPR